MHFKSRKIIIKIIHLIYFLILKHHSLMLKFIVQDAHKIRFTYLKKKNVLMGHQIFVNLDMLNPFVML